MTKPFEVEIFDVHSVQFHTTFDGVVESLNETDDSRLSGSTCTDKGNGMASWERSRQAFENRNVWPRRVVELDVLERDGAVNDVRLEPAGVSRVDRRDTVDSGEQFRGGTTSLADGLDFWGEHGEGEGTDEDRHEDVDDDSDVCSSLVHEDGTVPECETVRGVDDEDYGVSLWSHELTYRLHPDQKSLRWYSSFQRIAGGQCAC